MSLDVIVDQAIPSIRYEKYEKKYLSRKIS